MTTEVASLLGPRAVITTASDVQSIPAVESLAQEFDCMIEDPSQLKGVSSALVNGEDVILYGTDCRERLAELCSFTAHLKFCSKWEDLLRRPAAAYILLTNREEELHFDLLASKGVVCLLRPRNVLVGIGCRRGVTAEEVASAVFSGLREAHLSPLSVRELATIRIKENEEGLIEFAQRHDLPIRYYSLEELNAEEGPFPSEMVQALIGVKGVCEPAALLSAPGGRLILPKKKVGRVTMAVAEANFTS